MISIAVTSNNVKVTLYSLALAVGVAVITSVGLPQPADASAYYNNLNRGDQHLIRGSLVSYFFQGNEKVKFDFSCGAFCGNSYLLSQGQHASYPGKSGYIGVYAGAPGGGGVPYVFCVGNLPVDSHGWAKITTGNEAQDPHGTARAHTVILTIFAQSGEEKYSGDSLQNRGCGLL